MKKQIKKLIFGTGITKEKIKYGLGKGVRMSISLDHKLQRLYGLDEREIQKAFKRFSQLCDTYVDIGSSDGYYGLLYRKTNPGGAIFLFDANEVFIAEQKENFQLNNFDLTNVNLSSKFVSDHTGENFVALQDILPGNGKKIFIKIDVDGGELEVIKGLKEVLRKNDCKLIIETHSKDLEISCLDYLKKEGYNNLQIIDNAWWRVVIPEYRPIEHNRWLSAEK